MAKRRKSQAQIALEHQSEMIDQHMKDIVFNIEKMKAQYETLLQTRNDIAHQISMLQRPPK